MFNLRQKMQQLSMALWQRLHGPWRTDEQGLQQWREQILFSLYLSGVVLGLIAHLPGALRLIDRGGWWAALFNTLVYAIGAGVLLFPQRLAFRWRALLAVTLMHLVGIGVLAILGPFSGGYIWIFTSAVMAGLLLGVRASIVALAANTVTLIALGTAMVQGLLLWHPGGMAAVPPWLTASMNLLFLNAITAVSAAVMMRGLAQTLDQQRLVSAQLANERHALMQVRTRLEMEVVNRRNAEEKYRNLAEHANDGIAVIHNGRLVYANPKLAHLLGFTIPEMLDRPFTDFTDPAETERLERIYRRPRTVGPMLSSIKTALRRKDGHRVMVDLNGSYTDFEEGQAALVFVRDISHRMAMEAERQKLEDQLHQSQRLDSVGRLAGGVAHDFNNMLGVILGYTEMALKKAGPGQPLFADLTQIRNAAARSADLTRQLLGFARRQTVSPKVLDLNATVEGMLKMLRRLIGEDIVLEWRPLTDLWPVKVDPAQIDQILANLCVNARDAIAGVGTITIETCNTILDEAYCADHTECVPGRFVMLVVSDDGSGMDNETLAHIFEPFFTTKDASQGTGLGLAVVYGIVKQNDGFVNVYSEPEKGTTVKVYLPYHGGVVKIESTTEEAQIPDGRGETLLLLEDEPAILTMGRTMLEMLGYRVLTANTPGLALDLARANAGRIDLLITDVVMPEMNGRDLADRLHALYPDIKTLFMSGYTANVIAQRGMLKEGVHFIQKPFSMKDLGIKVRTTLDER